MLSSKRNKNFSRLLLTLAAISCGVIAQDSALITGAEIQVDSTSGNTTVTDPRITDKDGFSIQAEKADFTTMHGAEPENINLSGKVTILTGSGSISTERATYSPQKNMLVTAESMPILYTPQVASSASPNGRADR
ncbi:MAG: hypothetical protein QM599_08575 [Pseudoxanthomonas sp.]